MAKRDTRRYSPIDLRDMVAKGDVVPTRPDASEVHLGRDFWDKARVVMPAENGKMRISLRVDRDILAWFKRQGSGYQTRMNAVLRSFYEAQRHETKQ